MTYRANPLLKKLDRTAELTGMPALSGTPGSTRHCPFASYR